MDQGAPQVAEQLNLKVKSQVRFNLFSGWWRSIFQDQGYHSTQKIDGCILSKTKCNFSFYSKLSVNNVRFLFDG